MNHLFSSCRSIGIAKDFLEKEYILVAELNVQQSSSFMRRRRRPCRMPESFLCK